MGCGTGRYHRRHSGGGTFRGNGSKIRWSGGGGGGGGSSGGGGGGGGRRRSA